jgi:hypothetical protein
VWKTIHTFDWEQHLQGCNHAIFLKRSVTSFFYLLNWWKLNIFARLLQNGNSTSYLLFQNDDTVHVETLQGRRIQCKRVIVATPPNMAGKGSFTFHHSLELSLAILCVGAYWKKNSGLLQWTQTRSPFWLFSLVSELFFLVYCSFTRCGPLIMRSNEWLGLVYFILLSSQVT